MLFPLSRIVWYIAFLPMSSYKATSLKFGFESLVLVVCINNFLFKVFIYYISGLLYVDFSALQFWIHRMKLCWWIFILDYNVSVVILNNPEGRGVTVTWLCNFENRTNFRFYYKYIWWLQPSQGVHSTSKYLQRYSIV